MPQPISTRVTLSVSHNITLLEPPRDLPMGTQRIKSQIKKLATCDQVPTQLLVYFFFCTSKDLNTFSHDMRRRSNIWKSDGNHAWKRLYHFGASVQNCYNTDTKFDVPWIRKWLLRQGLNVAMSLEQRTMIGDWYMLKVRSRHLR